MSVWKGRLDLCEKIVACSAVDSKADLSLSYGKKKKVLIDLVSGNKSPHENNKLYLPTKGTPVDKRAGRHGRKKGHNGAWEKGNGASRHYICPAGALADVQLIWVFAGRTHFVVLSEVAQVIKLWERSAESFQDTIHKLGSEKHK